MTVIERRSLPNLSRGIHHPVLRRYPVAPLLALVTPEPSEVEGHHSSPESVLATQLCSRLDGTYDSIRHRVYKWGVKGLTEDEADIVAVTLGWHPCLVWADWFEMISTEGE